MAYTTQTFIDKASAIWGDRYDYTQVEYTGSTQKVIVSCDAHGEFLIAPSNHLKGQGCAKCAKVKHRQSNRREFINRRQ